MDIKFIKRVVLKGLLLFLLINFLFALVNPSHILGGISAYNDLFPGRERLPYGEKPAEAYNLSLYNVEAMFASHEISASKKTADEFRVVLIGDSSVWGYLLKPDNTLSAYIQSADMRTKNGQIVRVYNLGYPTMSLAKDMLIMNIARRYQPDLVIWMITLESLPLDKQLESPIVQNNASYMVKLISQYSLNLLESDPRFAQGNFLDSTLIGQRRSLADILRLQLYGILWAATGIDQYYPETYERPQEDLEKDDTFQGLLPPQLKADNLSFDILKAGKTLLGNVPIVYVNEPIYISHGENSNLRYNFFYPRWAYDQYREMFIKICQQNGWKCLDEWNLVPPGEFTNSAIHMTPVGTQQFAQSIINAIQPMILH